MSETGTASDALHYRHRRYCACRLFGELVPKQIALKNPEALAIRVARPLVAFTQIAAPLVWALNASANLVLRIFGIRAGFERQPYRRGHRRRFNRGGKVGTYSRGGA
jgi:hypothetical protein